MYSCKSLQIKNFTSGYLMQKLMIPCYGGTEQIPWNLKLYSVTGFCPLSTDSFQFLNRVCSQMWLNFLK